MSPLLSHPCYLPPPSLLRNSSLRRRISAISPFSSTLAEIIVARGERIPHVRRRPLPLRKVGNRERALPCFPFAIEPRTYPVRINAKPSHSSTKTDSVERRTSSDRTSPRLPAFVSFFPRNVGHATRRGTDTFMRSNCAFSSRINAPPSPPLPFLPCLTCPDSQ